ncbi:unnamed protein product [Cylicocyclus nassatus]|uniref:C-type lectin domain-containing protein n=1 Tax=Cylicocyclus nassatus TaxID=53992 RepID=A0AA36H0N1_CYLNA|nr:unnamed protein product [Cylicocyclus nassatus]
MQLLLFALLPLAGGFPYAKKNEPIFRNLNQYPGFFYMNRSNAAHRDRCESGWTYYDETDACYKSFFNKPFQAAESICISFGGHLTSIHSQKENLFVANLAQMGFNIPDWNWATWIGLVRSDYWKGDSNVTWIWTDGTVLDFISWGPTEPNGGQDGQRCVGLVSDPTASNNDILWYQKWFDIACTTYMRSFVCKKMALHDE